MNKNNNIDNNVQNQPQKLSAKDIIFNIVLISLSLLIYGIFRTLFRYLEFPVIAELLVGFICITVIVSFIRKSV